MRPAGTGPILSTICIACPNKRKCERVEFIPRSSIELFRVHRSNFSAEGGRRVSRSRLWKLLPGRHDWHTEPRSIRLRPAVSGLWLSEFEMAGGWICGRAHPATEISQRQDRLERARLVAGDRPNSRSHRRRGGSVRAALPLPSLDETEPSYVPGTEPQSSGFVPWRLFRKRSPVPSQGGVYVFAHFSGLPEPVVDLMSRAVIYIGYIGHDKNRRSLNQRLIEFQRTAHGLLGHSGLGPTERSLSRLGQPSAIRNTYVSWRVFQPGERPTANQFEQDQIKRYSQKWGKRPFVNRRD